MAYKGHNPRPEGRNLYLVSRGYLPYTHILLTVFQRELREFLIAEKVRLPVLKKKGPPPACATQQEVANFCDDQSCRPHQDRIVMAWFEPLSSKWNQECIALLAQKAQSTLRASIAAGKTPQFNKEWLLIDALCSQIETSLKSTKDNIEPLTEVPGTSRSPSSSSNTSSSRAARRAALARRRSRRTQVMIYLPSALTPVTDQYHRKSRPGLRYVNTSMTDMKNDLYWLPRKLLRELAPML